MGKKKSYVVNNNLRIVTVIKLKADNDRNGNPQRLFVLVNSTPSEIAPLTLSGNIITAIDEGFESKANVNKFIDEVIKPWHDVLVVWGPEFAVSKSEYRAVLKEHRGLARASWPASVQEARHLEKSMPMTTAQKHKRTTLVQRGKKVA